MFPGRGFDDGLGLLAAFAALRGNAQLATDFGKGGGTFRDGGADLAISDRFAEANVHENK